MTVKQLEKKLKEIGVPENLYSIMEGGLPDDTFCIVKEDKWKVYCTIVKRVDTLFKEQCLRTVV